MKAYHSESPGRIKILNSQYGAVLTDEDLEAEAFRRRGKLLFPIHVFPPAISPYVTALLTEMKGERGFVGLGVLQATATAIGSGLRAKMPTWDTCLAIWSCMVGISSSGKSMVQGNMIRPLLAIQRKYNEDFRNEYDLVEDPKDYTKVKQKVFIFQDTTFEALTRDILQNNFKGITRYEDELLKWLSDMERYTGSGNSEQSFWTSVWAASSEFTLRRASKPFVYVAKDHLVANVIGTTQPGLVHEFYKNLRLETGYVYRLLWAFPEDDRVISPNLSYEMPVEVSKPWENMLHRLFYELDMPHKESKPRIGRISPAGVAVFQAWQDKITNEINALDRYDDKNERAGIFGKVKEYALRFSVMLKAMHVACSNEPISLVDVVEEVYVQRGIELANYFLATGWEAYCIARSKLTVPAQVLIFYAELKAYNWNQSEMARQKGVAPQTIQKKFAKLSKDYPLLFSRS